MSHFHITEFACQCGCGLNSPSQELILRLDAARTRADIPFKITSGCRCGKHNAEIGGEENSAHMTNEYGLCEAVDISAITSKERYKIVESLLYAGFKRIGIGKTFVHGDVSKTKPIEVAWLY